MLTLKLFLCAMLRLSALKFKNKLEIFMSYFGDYSVNLPHHSKRLNTIEEVKDCLDQWSQATQNNHWYLEKKTGQKRDVRPVNPGFHFGTDRMWHKIDIDAYKKCTDIGLKIFEGNHLLQHFFIETAFGSHSYRKNEAMNGSLAEEEFELNLDFVDTNKKKYHMTIKIRAKDQSLKKVDHMPLNEQVVTLVEKQSKFSHSPWRDEPIKEDFLIALI